MPSVEDILKTAESQVGVTEYPPNSNNVLYNTDFYGHAVRDGVPDKNSAYPWCCTFVWWVFNQYKPCLVKKTASCMNLGQWFKDNGKWSSTPEVGDVVFFKFNTNNRWTNHVGIVKEVHSDYIITFEGNTSLTNQDNGGAVMQRQRNSNIVGYGRPAYESRGKESATIYKQGVDVSETQGNIDFEEMKEAGISFMCMRSTKKSFKADATFERNLSLCIANKIDYSCYKYAYAPEIGGGAKAEAQSVLKLLNGRKMTIWYDLEDKILIPYGVNGIAKFAEEFLQECQNAGYDVGIYCNKNWYDNYISSQLKAKYKFWIARYGKNTGSMDEKYKPTGKDVVAWQYTSKGKVPGIKGDVDRDVWL